MNRFEEIKALVFSLEDEFYKFYEKDNKAAGTRVRKGMQELKKIAQEVRENVLEFKEAKEGAKG
ncbi:histone H1 [Cardinium endosymbiont of Tipula unca]|uniref:histone H1 n=1 Tax=Cardinium endosymbiont of Tipula unca TaxID=3066216 RepID=UPI0030D09EC1